MLLNKIQELLKKLSYLLFRLIIFINGQKKYFKILGIIFKIDKKLVKKNFT